jgi:hypothetical protein
MTTHRGLRVDGGIGDGWVCLMGSNSDASQTTTDARAPLRIPGHGDSPA